MIWRIIDRLYISLGGILNNNFSKNLLVWVVIVIAAMTVFNMFNPSFNGTGNSMSYSEFLNSVNRGEVAEVKIQDRNITYRTQAGAELSTYAPDDPGLVEHLLNKNVRIDAVAPEEPSLLVSVLMSWFPMILLIGVWIFFMRQMQGGGGKAMSFGRSRARMIDANQAKVTFADVAGVDEAKEELSEVVEFLSNPKKFTRLGGRIPKGVLLVGPPGTGKTLLARAVAGEAGVPFFSISGSDFVEMFVGVGASRVRDLFMQGKKNAPCLIFTKSTPSAVREEPVLAAGTMKGSKPSTKCLWKWTVLNPMKASFSLRRRTAPMCLTLRFSVPDVLTVKWLFQRPTLEAASIF